MSRNLKHLLDIVRREQTFDRHEIARVRFGLWRCGRPGSVNMSFWVAYNGPALTVFGDIGELIYLPYDRNALRWAKNTRFDPQYPYYPMTKVSPQMRDREFVVEEATAYLQERIDECETSPVLDDEDLARWTKLKEAWDAFPSRDEPAEAQRFWYELWYRHGMDDPPSCLDFTPRVLWVYLATCWFMQHVSWNDPRFAEELRADR